MKTFAPLALVALLLAVIIASGSFFVVTPADQALVLQFGEIRRVATEPGVYVKIPMIQNVVYLDRRVLDFDPQAKPFILGDKTRLVVDTFTRYRITDPVLFYTSVGNEATLQARLENTVDGALREIFPAATLANLLSQDRVRVMKTIHDRVNADVKRFGIEVMDVRMRRADLPAENSGAVFARMKSEREREAAELRAQGQQQAQEIRSRADRERTGILSEAQGKAEVLRGDAERQAIDIVRDSYGRDPQFYAFYRSLQAYRNALTGSNTTLVLTPRSEFFRYLNELPSR
ncbi:MAG: protease modulator HflC [Pseudomonadota bacterium]|nr:protease modulator HflC [Pseudomonadota bacterium]